MNDAVAADAENRKKTKKRSSASSNALGVSFLDPVDDDAVDAGSAINNEVLKKLDSLTGAVRDLGGSVQVLEGRVNSITDDPSHHTHPLVKRFMKCQACEAAGLFCRHCSRCGEDGHQRRECPKNV